MQRITGFQRSLPSTRTSPRRISLAQWAAVGAGSGDPLLQRLVLPRRWPVASRRPAAFASLLVSLCILSRTRLVPSDRPICLLVDGILVSCRSTACWLRDAFRYFVDRWFLTIRQYLASLFNICGPNTPSVPGPLPSALSARGPAFVLACIDVLYICTT